MGKPKYKTEKFEETEFIDLADVHMHQRTVEKLHHTDKHQIEKMRICYEEGRSMVRVVLRPRADGGFNVEDGRHRVLAAKMAGEQYIEAIIVGQVQDD